MEGDGGFFFQRLTPSGPAYIFGVITLRGYPVPVPQIIPNLVVSMSQKYVNYDYIDFYVICIIYTIKFKWRIKILNQTSKPSKCPMNSQNINFQQLVKDKVT